MFDEDELVEELSEYFNLPRDEARHYLLEGNVYYREEWNRLFGPHPPKTKEEIEEFYKKSMFAAFDLAKWHRNDNMVEFHGRKRSFYERYAFEAMNYLEHLPKKVKVFDFGGGIGSMDIRIAEMGHDVTSYDIGEKTQGLARFRAKKRGLDIKFVNEIPREKFDVVICYDVLEHVFDIESCIKKISDLLVPGGHAFIKVTFPTGGNEDRENPSHLQKHVGWTIRTLFPILRRHGLYGNDSDTHFIKR